MPYLSQDIEIKLKELIETTNTAISAIGKQLGLSHSTTHRWVANNYTIEYRKQRSSQCYSDRSKKAKYFVGLTRDKHYKYKEKTYTIDGYVLILKPEWYTARKSQYRAYEHHIVYCFANGLKEIPKGYCVHHIDFNKTNNTLDNLRLMTHSEHGKLHREVQLDAHKL